MGRLGVLTCSLGATVVSAADWLMKGISYGVSPDQGKMESDDMFNDPARAQWGCPGRGDLALMAQLGANAVRLYGNDPRWNHDSFLDEAQRHGLGVMPGISDWPYMQDQDSCVGGHGSCYNAIRASYLENLMNGFAGNGTGAYHPAMRAMIAVNEPDLKLGSKPKQWALAVISAIDGMLSAEEDAGIKGATLPITATVSFMICEDCEEFNEVPGLGQMWTLRDAMQNPSKYGYTPKHDLAAFYDARFINSFNTGNPAREVEAMFLEPYSNSTEFAGKPVFIAEYHCPSEPVHEDFQQMMKIVGESSELLGVSFFEWINRHDQGGHTDWGIFNLDRKGSDVAVMNYNGTLYDIKRLIPTKDKGGAMVAESIARAYGGQFSQRPMCQGQGILLP